MGAEKAEKERGHAVPPKKEKCDRCPADAAITLGYGPHRLCERHFIDFFEKRFRKTVRKYKLFGPKEKILVALSGGKDSTLLLHLLKKFYSRQNKIEALIIDEGVKGYRDKAIGCAKKNCRELGVKHAIVSFKKEFGITNDKLMPLITANQKMGGACAFCGTLRRNLMNKYAKRTGADKLATGHNLDDEVQSFVMNVFNNDFERMKRMGAGAGMIEHQGFVKRIKPLYETPEKEIVAYCAFCGIRHYSEECCPYSWAAKRNEYREMLNSFENRFPGTHYSILRFCENIRPLALPKKSEKKALAGKLGECRQCSEPTEKGLCKACEMVALIREEKGKTDGKKGAEKRRGEKPAGKGTKHGKRLTCAATKRG